MSEVVHFILGQSAAGSLREAFPRARIACMVDWLSDGRCRFAHADGLLAWLAPVAVAFASGLVRVYKHAVTPDDGNGAAARAGRLERFARGTAALSALGADELREQIAGMNHIGVGIGGTTGVLDVAGDPVFVKRLPLTDLERTPDNLMSTANLFDLPVVCHYGVGFAPSVGAWRELAASTMATEWTLAGRLDCFPLLYHWRVVDGAAFADALPDELADRDRAVAHWHGSPAVGHRIDAIARSTASLVLMFEYVAHHLPEWLAVEVAAGSGEAAVAIVERALRFDLARMNAAGLLHFDAHLGNMLTDGARVYFADLGLATSPRFALSPDEAAFIAANAGHDPCHAITRLVDWLVTELAGAPDWLARNDAIARVAAGGTLGASVPAWAAAIIERYAPVAAVINEFYRQLHLEDRRTPYPAAAVHRACATAGLDLAAADGDWPPRTS
jgi:hypothetical protein